MSVAIDLTGMQFGRLTVVELTSKKYHGERLWLCQCNCGNTCEVTASRLKSGAVKSCGCLKKEISRERAIKMAENEIYDLTGQRFGRLVAIERTEKTDKLRNRFWLCQCDCGNTCEVSTTALKNGNTKSCGCLTGRSSRDNPKEMAKNSIYDLTGQRFGRLVAIEPTGKTDKSGNRIWLCQCDCGNMCEVASMLLKRSSTRSCGCLIEVDLTGKKFGRLTVIERTKKIDKSGCHIWLCRCDCGNIREVPTGSLTNGNTKSCGCLKSESSRENAMKMAENNILDLTGQRFGRLVAIRNTGKKDKTHSYVWLCRCDCGNMCKAPVKALTIGATKSCGCLMKEHIALIEDKIVRFDTNIARIASKKIPANNTSGVEGVYYMRGGFYKGKYFAEMGFQKVNYRLGYYDTLEEAAYVRQEAEKIRDDFLVWYNSLTDEEKEEAAQKYDNNELPIKNIYQERMEALLHQIGVK